MPRGEHVDGTDAGLEVLLPLVLEVESPKRPTKAPAHSALFVLLRRIVLHRVRAGAGALRLQMCAMYRHRPTIRNPARGLAQG